jgi:hypothetical protein
MPELPEITRFQPREHQDGWHVVDAWNNDTLIAICPKLDAAATLGFFLNKQDSLAIQQRKEFLKSLPFIEKA